MLSAVVAGEIPETKAPTQAQRADLTARRGAVVAALRVRDARELAGIVGSLMTLWPLPALSEAEARRVVVAYVGALGDLPPWSVAAAAHRFVSGAVEGSNPSFRPSAAEIATEARRVLAPLQTEFADLDRVLSARVVREIGPEERASVQRRLAALSASLAQAVEAKP